jgi:hypothetical protein
MSDPHPGEPGPSDEPGTPPTHQEYGQQYGQPYDPSSYGGQPYGGQPYGQQPYGGQPYGGQPYGGAPGFGYGAPVPNHPSATTAMVLGLVGLIGLVLCGGVTLLLSPFAWRIGARAVREIDAEPGRYAGRDQANAGRIMGLIGTVLLGLGVLLILGGIVLLLGVSTSSGVSTGTHAVGG